MADVRSSLLPHTSPRNSFGALCDYARDRMDDHLKYDRSTCRAQPEYKDQRVHVCLYFLTPRQLE